MRLEIAQNTWISGGIAFAFPERHEENAAAFYWLVYSRFVGGFLRRWWWWWW
jgi:hypothetical protein